MKCLKVMKRERGHLCSTYADPWCRLWYEPGKKAKAQYGRPFVYVRMQDAVLHAGQIDDAEIWECECRNLYREREVSGSTSLTFIKGYWEYRKHGFLPYQWLNLVPLSKGAMVFTTEWVTPLRRLA
jgi:hypothetical protein